MKEELQCPKALKYSIYEHLPKLAWQPFPQNALDVPQ
jgi:hypothetical protein